MIGASITNLGAPQSDQLGDNDYAENRALLSFIYRNAGFDVYLSTRYLDSIVRSLSWVEGVDIDDNRIPSSTYTDLRLGYTFGQGAGNWSIFANV